MFRGNKKKTDFFSGFPGAVHTQSKPVGEWTKLLKDERKIKSLGTVGYCWGYKVAVTMEGSQGLFDAIAAAHPSYVSSSSLYSQCTSLIPIPGFVAIVQHLYRAGFSRVCILGPILYLIEFEADSITIGSELKMMEKRSKLL